MALVLGVNSYATLDEADLYFENRLDVAAWSESTDDMKEQALMTATQYIDQLSFAGYTTEETQYLAWPRVATITVASRGREISFTKDYSFADSDLSLQNDFDTALASAPYEIRLLKKATFEQAYHLLNNEGLFDFTGESPESIKVGSIELTGLGNTSEAPEKSSLMVDLLKPLRGKYATGQTTWFRAN